MSAVGDTAAPVLTARATPPRDKFTFTKLRADIQSNERTTTHPDESSFDALTSHDR